MTKEQWLEIAKVALYDWEQIDPETNDSEIFEKGERLYYVTSDAVNNLDDGGE